MSQATALREEALAKLLEAKGLVVDGAVKAEDEDRFQALMGEFRELDSKAAKAQGREADIGALDERMAYYTGKATGTPMRFNRTVLDPNAPRSLGDQFIQSQAYKDLQESGALGSDNSKFRSAPVILDPRAARISAAASDIINTESAQPANALVTPYYLPGIQPLPQAPLTMRDVLPVANMPTGDTISYAAQTGFDNAAAAVEQATAANGSGASGGVKPQSSIAWTRRTETAETIATWMATTRQALADADQTRALIDNQGRLMIRIEEDDQLLNGNGTSPNISGILDRTIQTLDLTGVDNLDGVRTARRLVKTGVSRLDPNFIALNPEDSEEFDLLKNAMGEYRGGNPIGNFAMDQTIWRLRRVETEALTAGTALVGASAGATIFDRQPLTVLTTDSHSDFFVRNLVVILFEERLALAVYFPTAFVEVTLSEWVG